MTMPTSRELSYKDRVTYIEGLFQDYFMKHKGDDCTSDFLRLQANIWDLARQRPSDTSCMNILGHLAWRSTTHTRALWDDETQDDYMPEDEGYALILSDHIDSKDQEIRGHIQQLIRR